ncbi:MAG: hypothetical protein QXJ06_02920 [Candidatus Aenigmatarchaeota archaeon]
MDGWLFLLLIFLPIILIVVLSIFAGLVISSLFLLLIGFTMSGFIIFIGMMIAPTYPKIGRYLSYVGVIGIMILLIIIEGSIIGLSGFNLGKKFIQNNYSLWTECDQTPINSINFLSCALTGHQPLPTKVEDIWGWLGIYGFYIFGLIAPLFILTALFADFVETSGFVQNPKYQKIIGFGLGFMAYRGFIVTRLIYILDIGSTGVAMIALNFIWLGGILGYIRKSFQQWKLLEEESELKNYIPNLRKNLIAIIDSWQSVAMAIDALNSRKFKNSLSLFLDAVDIDVFTKRIAQTSQQDLQKFKEELKAAIRSS